MWPCCSIKLCGSSLNESKNKAPFSSGQRPSSVASNAGRRSLRSHIIKRAPGKGFLLTFMCATTRFGAWPGSSASTRSTNNSSCPPLAFSPKRRAFTTCVSLNTSRSPAFNKPGNSRKIRSTGCKGSRASSRREPLRSAAGCWAINSGGSWKSKSLSVNWRTGEEGMCLRAGRARSK